MFLLMLQGGLRPGEVLNLHLEDIQYGRRRVLIRHRTDHPKGARTKSQLERVVDLHEPETLAAVSAYALNDRPADAPTTPCVPRRRLRRQPERAPRLPGADQAVRPPMERLGLNGPGLTPHALRDYASRHNRHSFSAS